MSNETKCETNNSIITKWNDVHTHNCMQLTKYHQYTNDVVHTDACVVHHALSSHTARTLAHLVMSSHTSLSQDLSHVHLWPPTRRVLFDSISFFLSVVHWRTSLIRFSSSISVCFCLCSSFTTMENLRTSANKGANDALRRPHFLRRLWAQFHDLRRAQRFIPFSLMISSTDQDADDAASCSQRQTEDKPIVANQKACQSDSQSSFGCVRRIKEIWGSKEFNCTD